MQKRDPFVETAGKPCGKVHPVVVNDLPSFPSEEKPGIKEATNSTILSIISEAVEVAERITSLLPTPLEKVFFSDNGSTANEVALKMVFQYFYNQGKKKTKIIAR